MKRLLTLLPLLLISCSAISQCSIGVSALSSGCSQISFAISTVQTFQPTCTGYLTTVVAPNISAYSDDLRMTGHSVIARMRSSTGTLLASSNLTDQWYPGATVTFSFPCTNLILTSGTTYRLEFYDTTTMVPQEGLILFCRSTSSVYAGGNMIQDGVSNASADLYGWTVNIASSNIAGSSSSSTQTQPVSSCRTYYNGANEVIALVQSGSIAMGSTTAKVTVQGSAPVFNGQPYVRRFYDITPTTNKNTATSDITLFFSQTDFDDFNALNGSYPDLPTGPSDVSGIANLRITQEHGTSVTGTPGTFTGWAGAGPASVLITPTNVSWNSMVNRWEVSFPVTGFSGFFAHTGTGVPLNVSILNFNAKAEGNGNRISWQIAADEEAFFEIERSSDAATFSIIGSVNGTESNHSYSYYDGNPIAPVSYYRLRYSGHSGSVLYSNILAVNRNADAGLISISPLPAQDILTITSTPGAAIGQTAMMLDMQGRVVYQFHLELMNQIDVHSWQAGVYTLHLADGRVLRIMKQ